MFTEAVDRPRGLVVWLFSGRENSDADLEAFVRSIAEMSSRRDGPPTSAICVVDPGNPPGNAAWRKRIAEASAAAPSEACVVLVTRSVVVRGVLTAVLWLLRPTFAVSTHETFDEALAWTQSRRGRDLPALRRLYEQARAAADSAHRGVSSVPPGSVPPASSQRRVAS